MRRESQSLQIALIVFVMLTIVLGVTSFVFFHQYDEARRGQEHALREAGQYRAAARNLQEEVEQGNVEGELTVQTRYLVVGSPPDERADPDVHAALARMLRQAETLGIEQIRLPRLLEQMGWRRPRTPAAL